MTKHNIFVLQMLIALFVSVCIVIPVLIYKVKKYSKEGRSLKNIEIKLVLKIAMPILSIPVLMSDLAWYWKIVMIIVAGLSGVAYDMSIGQTRKTLRRMLGLPPEDEHTGMVIKEEDKKSKNKD